MAKRENGEGEITRNTPVEHLPFLLTVSEFCTWTAQGRSSVYDQIANDEIPVRRFGRSIRIPRSFLERGILGKENT